MKHFKHFLIAFALIFSSSLTGQIEKPDTFLDNVSGQYWEISLGFFQKLPLSKKRALLVKWDLGYIQKSLVFEEYYVFNNSQGSLEISPDLNPNHSYPEKIFKRGFSRLSGRYISINPNIVLFTPYKHVFFSTGPLFDIRIGSVHKRKFYADGKKMKDKLNGNGILNLSNFQVGWEATLYAFGIGINYQYMFNNFFKEEWKLDFKYHSIGVKIGF